jgi:hypothetical protein
MIRLYKPICVPLSTACGARLSRASSHAGPLVTEAATSLSAGLRIVAPWMSVSDSPTASRLHLDSGSTRAPDDFPATDPEDEHQSRYSEAAAPATLACVPAGRGAEDWRETAARAAANRRQVYGSPAYRPRGIVASLVSHN